MHQLNEPQKHCRRRKGKFQKKVFRVVLFMLRLKTYNIWYILFIDT